MITIEWKRSRHLGERDRHTETEIGREKQSQTYRETERARERERQREKGRKTGSKRQLWNILYTPAEMLKSLEEGVMTELIYTYRSMV